MSRLHGPHATHREKTSWALAPPDRQKQTEGEKGGRIYLPAELNDPEETPPSVTMDLLAGIGRSWFKGQHRSVNAIVFSYSSSQIKKITDTCALYPQIAQRQAPPEEDPLVEPLLRARRRQKATPMLLY